MARTRPTRADLELLTREELVDVVLEIADGCVCTYTALRGRKKLAERNGSTPTTEEES